MSDRRRSLFILLLVAGLMAASLAVVATKSTKLGLDLKGGVQLVYQAKPTAQQPKVTQDALARALDIMRQRVDAFGVAEPEIRQLGNDQIQVNLPGVSDAARAAQQVGTTAQLFFYDWEKVILDENCKTDDSQPNGGETPIAGCYAAVKQASKCPAQPDSNNNASDKPRFYAFDKISHKPLNNGQPFDSRAAALAALPPSQRARAEVLEVPVGILVIRDEKPAPDKNGNVAKAPDRWWVIKDAPALSGTDIKNPE